MSDAFKRTQDAKCMSDYQVDKWAFQAAFLEAEAAACRSHLASCTHCQQRINVARCAQPPNDLNRLLRAVNQSEPKVEKSFAVRLARRWPQMALLAAAGVAALWILPAAINGPTTTAFGERTKSGASRLNVIRRNGKGRVDRVLSGEAVMPGDSLRFEVASAHAAFVAVVSLDAGGNVTAFVPPSGAALAVAGGVPSLLEGAVVLDAVPGPEQLWMAACRNPFDVSEVVRGAERALVGAAGSNARIKDLFVPQHQCEFDAVTLTKEVKP